MTKEVYIAYFDLLGFKQFIKNNTEEHIDKRMGHIIRDMEYSLSLGKLKGSTTNPSFAIPNINNAKVNCVNISDTIIYWTNDLDIDSLYYLLQVSSIFNNIVNLYNFPVRGCLTKGYMNHIMGKHPMLNNTLYAVQCPYGKGLVNAHEKAESQQWAGTVIDQSVIQDLKVSQYASSLDAYCVKYKVPYKNGGNIVDDEYVLKLSQEINNATHLKNIKISIQTVFSADNKPVEGKDIKEKIDNTLFFVDYQYKSNSLTKCSCFGS